MWQSLLFSQDIISSFTLTDSECLWLLSILKYKCVCLFLIFHWIPLGFRFHLWHSTSLVSGIVSDRIYSSWPVDRFHNSDLAWPLMRCPSLSFDRSSWDNFMTSSVLYSLMSAMLIVDSWRRNICPWERITDHLLGCLMVLGGFSRSLELFIPISFTNVCSHSSIEIMKNFITSWPRTSSFFASLVSVTNSTSQRTTSSPVGDQISLMS